MSTDFSSIDRLVEFGLGLGVAQQMVNTMNHAIGNMTVPGTFQKTDQIPAINYYAIVDGKQAGPLSTEEVTAMTEKGIISRETLMWRNGMKAWMFACDIPEVNKLILLSGPKYGLK